MQCAECGVFVDALQDAEAQPADDVPLLLVLSPDCLEDVRVAAALAHAVT